MPDSYKTGLPSLIDKDGGVTHELLRYHFKSQAAGPKLRNCFPVHLIQAGVDVEAAAGNKKANNITDNNFDKFKRTFIIVGRQH